MTAAASEADAGHVGVLQPGDELPEPATTGSIWPVWEALRRLLRPRFPRRALTRWESKRVTSLSGTRFGKRWSHFEYECFLM